MTPEQEAAEVSHADIIRGARDHYEDVSTKAHSWLTTIVHAIDALEREPALLAELATLRATIEAQRKLVEQWRELEVRNKKESVLFVRADAAACALGVADGLRLARRQLAATLPPQAE